MIKPKPFVWRDPQNIPCRQWLYGRHLIRKFGSATIALGGVGKSSLQIVEALAMVTDRPLLGVQPNERCRVWLWNGEDPLEEVERRIAAACLHFGITPMEIDGGLFVNSGRDPEDEIIIATQTRNGVVIANPVVEELMKAIRDNKIDVLQIDPFVSSHRVTENDNGAIDTVAKVWTRIADATKTAIDLCHHSRKTGGAEVTVEDGRGAVALINACRSARVLNMMSPEEAKKAGIEKRKRYFKVENGKANMAVSAEFADWHHLASVDLHNNPLGPVVPGDSVGVATKWKLPDPLDGVTGADFDRVALVIRTQGPWRADTQAKRWVGVAIAKALKLRATDKTDRAKIIGLLKVWIGTGSLIEVEQMDPGTRKMKTFVVVAEED